MGTAEQVRTMCAGGHLRPLHLSGGLLKPLSRHPHPLFFSGITLIHLWWIK